MLLPSCPEENPNLNYLLPANHQNITHGTDAGSGSGSGNLEHKHFKKSKTVSEDLPQRRMPRRTMSFLDTSSVLTPPSTRVHESRADSELFPPSEEPLRLNLERMRKPPKQLSWANLISPRRTKSKKGDK
eukprot:TRINITY_DN7503_c0_g1_i2.p1 TRINITY_DN7503_c0_g1~~TRINITY_DN7503_c0_g1_i2.p1  ORF type:complete len:130 (-),score=24.12 TRINITY_DN7503_c0_g1_i2:67-456(-)